MATYYTMACIHPTDKQFGDAKPAITDDRSENAICDMPCIANARRSGAKCVCEQRLRKAKYTWILKPDSTMFARLHAYLALFTFC